MARALAYGLGFRSKHYARVVSGPAATADFFEVLTENFLTAGGRPRRFLAALKDRYPLVMHGVSLSIAGKHPLDDDYLRALKGMTQWIRPKFVSDHLCWTGQAHRNAHDLLPVPLTETMLAHVAGRVKAVQDRIDQRLYLENPSAYVAYANDDMDEATFLAELVARTGCGLLLDVNNLYVNTMNLGYQPHAYLAKIPVEAVGYFHLAGHSVSPGVRIDTHDDHVIPEVWDLYRAAVRRFPGAATLVEWDDKIPEYDELDAELALAKTHRESALQLGAPTTVSEPKTIVRAPESKTSDDRVLDDFMNMVVQPDHVAATDDRLALLAHDRPVDVVRGINVYNDAYFIRIRDVFRDELPTLYALTGGCVFDRLLMRYLIAHPSESFDITYAGTKLAEFLTGDGQPALASVAALELARFELYSAPDGKEPLTIEALAARDDAAWADATFRFRPAVRLVKTSHDPQPAWAAVAEGQAPVEPAAGETHILVYRHDDDVGHDLLTPSVAALYAALASGARFADACSAMGALDEEAAVMGAAQELARWTALGLVAAED